MLSIGAFAQLGQVTHRMLRHWDTAGLLAPAHVDEHTGYRSYDPAQLDRLHRIMALRRLGLGLEDTCAILERGFDVEHAIALLQVRRRELEQEHRVAQAQLIDVERRLQLIQKENMMSHIEIVEKALPAMRLAARSTTVADQPALAGVVGPLFDATAAALGKPYEQLDSPTAVYVNDENGLTVTVGYAYSGDSRDGFDIVDLPAVESAMCAVHLGTMATIHESWQALHREIVARGFVPSASCRELYVRAESEDQSDWVTELQQPVTRA